MQFKKMYVQGRRNRGVRLGAANFYFWSIEKIVLKWKIVQNYKTSLNSSKFIDIYNIITVLDTEDDFLSVMNPKPFSYF